MLAMRSLTSSRHHSCALPLLPPYDRAGHAGSRLVPDSRAPLPLGSCEAAGQELEWCTCCGDQGG